MGAFSSGGEMAESVNASTTCKIVTVKAIAHSASSVAEVFDVAEATGQDAVESC
jgi:hypothetical protein